MSESIAILTPEEREKLEQLQDRLIECYVERRQALAKGRKSRAEELSDEITDLLGEKQEIEKWATAGSA